jgi:N-acetyl-anhydromuramyl-L-alanine amidase AmpD
VDEIDEWHKARGWSGVGYHAVIRRNGQIEFGRHFDETGAHVKGWNTRSVGVCMVGGVNGAGDAEDNFTTVQYDSLRSVLGVLAHAYPSAQVVGHRDLSPDLNGDGIITQDEWLKDCPCFDVTEWLYGSD